MAIFSTKIEVLHSAPTPHGFFNGYGGHQIRAKVIYLFDWRIRIKELDREDVPHWHYVQWRTLGSSEWRSRLIEEAK